MMLVRPVQASDLDDLARLAAGAQAGLTTLPPQRDMLEKKIQVSLEAFQREATQPGDDHYLFVLEDSASGKVLGTSGLVAAVGVSEAFYSYKLGTTVHACRELGVYNKFETLHLSNDYTGATELCTLFLDPEHRGSQNGKLLSRSRFLFMAAFPRRFAPRVIAEMRGYADDKGRSPFWEGLGRHFFSMDFSQADFLSGVGNKSFIAELMPRHLVYVNLLTRKVRNTIGKVHDSTAPALHLLEKEGFSFRGYVDIFDAGPTVEAPMGSIRTIRKSRPVVVSIGRGKKLEGASFLVSNTKCTEFRCCLTPLPWPDGDHIPLTSTQARQLRVADGETVRVTLLT